MSANIDPALNLLFGAPSAKGVFHFLKSLNNIFLSFSTWLFGKYTSQQFPKAITVKGSFITSVFLILISAFSEI